MKQLIKKHAMVLVALIIAAGTMSFKMAENTSEQSINWFAVSANGDISSTKMTPGANCEPDPTDEYCAVGFTSLTPPVSHIDETTLEGGAQPVAGALYREE